MGKISGWLKGKKTYLAAGLSALAVAVLVALGKISVAQALQIVSIAALASGMRDALATHQAEVVSELQAIAKTGADYSTHNLTAVAGDLVAVGQGAVQLGAEIAAENAAAGKAAAGR